MGKCSYYARGQRGAAGVKYIYVDVTRMANGDSPIVVRHGLGSFDQTSAHMEVRIPGPCVVKFKKEGLCGDGSPRVWVETQDVE